MKMKNTTKERVTLFIELEKLRQDARKNPQFYWLWSCLRAGVYIVLASVWVWFNSMSQDNFVPVQLFLVQVIFLTGVQCVHKSHLFSNTGHRVDPFDYVVLFLLKSIVFLSMTIAVVWLFTIVINIFAASDGVKRTVLSCTGVLLYLTLHFIAEHLSWLGKETFTESPSTKYKLVKEVFKV